MTDEAEVAQLRELLASMERENNLLRNLLSDAARPKVGSARPAPIQIGSRERMDMLQQTVDKLDWFVSAIAQDECYGCDDGEGSKCNPCSAKAVLESIKLWRYGGSATIPSRRFQGSFHGRTTSGWNPRETKIHAAWVKHMETWGPDRTLGMILTEDRQGLIDFPDASAWYVATSVVQWLVTAIGSGILEAAGWKYMFYDEDRKVTDAKMAERYGSDLPL